MQELTVRLVNFRAFAKTPPLNIRPLTFLIGENSAGKTSLLAALNFLLRFQEGDASPRLNTEPFDLGSFDQISHQAKGAHTTATEFILSLSKRVDINRRSGILSLIVFGSPNKGREGPVEADFQDCDLDITFGSVFGSAEVVSLLFTTCGLKLSINLYKTVSISVVTEDGETVELHNKATSPFLDDIGPNNPLSIRSLGFALQTAIYTWRSDETRDKVVDKKIERLFSAYSAVMNSLPDYVFSSSPIRSVPERVYSASDVRDSPDGRSTPYKLRQLKVADRLRWKRLNVSLNNFGKLSGLFKRLDIGKLTREAAGPFQLRLHVGGRRENIADVGYGVSQTLPLVNELLEAPESASFLFQQPEVHLHPKAQAGLGTFFSEYIAAHLRSLLVIETHSDYLIDRVRNEIRRGNIPTQAVSLIYLETRPSGTEVYNISLDERGNVVNPPNCYREFFLREEANVMGIL